MKAILRRAITVQLAIVFALLSLISGLIALNIALTNAVIIESVAVPPSFSDLVKNDREALDAYVKSQIDGYILAQKQQNIDRKYDEYSEAQVTTRTGKHIYGHEDARFTLVEFSDLECPFCKRYHSTPKEIVDASSGRVNWEWKHFPLPSHNPVAAVEAHASECVEAIKGNHAFWVFIHEVFEKTNGNGQGAGDLISIATSIGVNGDMFADCMRQGKMAEKVRKDRELAAQMNVNSTPITFVVDNHTGKQVQLRGMRNPEAIVSTIQRLIKEQTAHAEFKEMR